MYWRVCRTLADLEKLQVLSAWCMIFLELFDQILRIDGFTEMDRASRLLGALNFVEL